MREKLFLTVTLCASSAFSMHLSLSQVSMLTPDFRDTLETPVSKVSYH